MASLLPACALLLALAIDRAWGEPPTRWHPVGWMGRYLAAMGLRIAPCGLQAGFSQRLFWAGALAWTAGALLVLVAALLVGRLAAVLGPVAGTLLVGAVLKTMLSWRMLRKEVGAVEAALGRSLDQGCQQLRRLVSRDVEPLDAAQVRESAIESLAENLNDSVVAPLFWFLVAGLPGAMVYRFANTADAMWGYRGLRGGRDWTCAGKWAARADDVLSWIPARLTALLLALVHGGLRLDRLRAQARVTPSPNGGWPMGAMALALGVSLRKPGVYTLNAGAPAPQAAHTARAIRLGSRSVGLLAVTGSVVLLLAGVIGARA